MKILKYFGHGTILRGHHLLKYSVVNKQSVVESVIASA